MIQWLNFPFKIGAGDFFHISNWYFSYNQVIERKFDILINIKYN